MCCENNNQEIYEGHLEKVLGTIMKEKLLSREEAVKLLNKTDEENPLECLTESFWLETQMRIPE